MASTRTVLNIVEKGLDGVPAPGLKAVVGAVGEIVKALQVRGAHIYLINRLIDSIDECGE
jgi:hypothetical protein